MSPTYTLTQGPDCVLTSTFASVAPAYTACMAYFSSTPAPNRGATFNLTNASAPAIKTPYS